MDSERYKEYRPIHMSNNPLGELTNMSKQVLEDYQCQLQSVHTKPHDLKPGQ
jgi:hypothetical protein